MPRIPDVVSPMLLELTHGLPRVLGANLVGLYVYGSVLGSEFDPAHSDVDCIAVTLRALDEAAFGRLDRWLTEAALEEPWFMRLQVLFLVRRSLLVEDPRACLCQQGVLKRSGSDGNPIIWMDFFQRGRALLGPRPESFVPEITAEILRRALVREVGYLQEELFNRPDSVRRDAPSYRGYAVLTLCRILYSLQTGEITSKRRAARWATDHTPMEWHDLIERALTVSETGASEGLPLARIEGFIDYVGARVDPRSAAD